jgi:hypothetical protein
VTTRWNAAVEKVGNEKVVVKDSIGWYSRIDTGRSGHKMTGLDQGTELQKVI